MALSSRRLVPDISQALVVKAEEMNYEAWGDICPPPGWCPDGGYPCGNPNPNGSYLPEPTFAADKALYFSPGAVWLRTLRDACLARIQNAQMSTLISANVNGESFTKEIAIDPAAMLDQVNTALRELLGTEVRMTYSHFKNIPL